MPCIHYKIVGRVQGVGFRYFTLRTARKLGITGWVRNRSDGSVEAVAEGHERLLADFEAAIRQGPSFSHVETISRCDWDPPSTPSNSDSPRFIEFEIRH